MSASADTAGGVWVTGHVRSGTSMVAGLIREHGVFFGDCGGGVADNPKGRVENLWLKRAIQTNRLNGWPGAWFQRLKKEGWDGWSPWGAKLMPGHWDVVGPLKPKAVVMCYRPERDILASCARVPFGRSRSLTTIRERWRDMANIEREAREMDIVVCKIDTPRIVRGDMGQLRPALTALGLEASAAAWQAWIDPELWHGSVA